MRNKTSFLLFLGLLTQQGCWLTQNQTATGEYARAVMVAQQRSAVLEHSVIETQTRLKRLETILQRAGQSEALRLETIDQVNVEVSRLRGQIEMLRHELGLLKQSVDDSFMDFEQRQLYDELRLDQLEGFLGVQPPPPPVDPLALLEVKPCAEGEECPPPEVCAEGQDCTETEAPEGQEPSLAIPEDAPGKLALAKTRLDEGRFRVARVILEKAIQVHRESTELPEIRYRLGQTWMEEKNWAKAVSIFQSVLDNHERSDWAAWAMVRQGDCFEKMGQPENAKLFFEEVQRLYPRSAATKEAKGRLK